MESLLLAEFVLSIEEQNEVRRILDEFKRRGYIEADEPVIRNLRERLWREYVARQPWPPPSLASDNRYHGD